MTQTPPSYFGDVATAARRRWDQLEADPELRAPWDLLFKQVQSPRHVVSELLQNADDAGATSVHVSLNEQVFEFSHNGEDFTDSQFGSLCKFGFSNKRSLHTIGFRGIGFKSVFSLGEAVEILTPTLGVRFDRRRFTEPVWIGHSAEVTRTIIRVDLKDPIIREEIRNNLAAWLQQPAALLFFPSIRKFTIQGHAIARHSVSEGPAPGSEYVRLVGSRITNDLLLIRGDSAAFPIECLEEIRQERNAPDLELPPCRVDVVVGLPEPQRLFVVLPTGVSVPLPFSVNAPFVQDPARNLIKDPGISPTNRWLIRRAGSATGIAMVQWLRRSDLEPEIRAAAYQLLPPPSLDKQPNGLGTDCARAALAGLTQAIHGREIVLGSDHRLHAAGRCFAVPGELSDVWAPAALERLFARDTARLISPQIGENAARNLRDWTLIRIIHDDEVLRYLEKGDPPPRPESWEKLERLWRFVARDNRWMRTPPYQVVPVAGESHLFAAAKVIRPPARTSLPDAEWQFVSSYVSVIDPGWLAYLAPDGIRPSVGSAAGSLLRTLGLHEAADLDRIFENAAAKMGQRGSPATWLRLAQNIALAGTTVPPSFRYLTRHGHLPAASAGVVFDQRGVIEALTPVRWAELNLLHSDYLESFGPCPRSQWLAWLGSEKSRLLGAPRLVTQEMRVSRKQVDHLLTKRQCTRKESFPYKLDQCVWEDVDFEPELVAHWEDLAWTDPDVWMKVTTELLRSPSHAWQDRTSVRITQQGYSKMRTITTEGPVPARWIERTRALQSLPDTFGSRHVPAELLYRTPATEPLLGVEPFIASELDTAVTRPLLRLLGVRETATGTEGILSRLQALSKGNEPLRILAEIAKWCQALDRMAVRLETAELSRLRATFESERLILSRQGEWLAKNEAYQEADEDDGPDAPVVHSVLAGLTLWDRLGVPRRPTWAALASSLTAIPQHSSLADDLLPRVKRLLRRFPAEVWSEVGCWVSLGKTWEPVDAFNYRRSASGISHGGDLFQQLLLQIADVRMLPSDRIEAPPFGHLPEIGGAIELRLSDLASTRDPRSLPRWLEILGFGLRRVRLKEDVKTEQVRQLAADLTSTKWLECDRIDVTPYCAGMPAGPAFRRDALWEKTRFLIRTARSAKMQRAVAEELARHFRTNEVREAVLACFEREPGFVRDYLEDTFELEAEAITQLGPVPDVPHATENEPSESRNAGTAVASGAVMKWNTENTAAEREDVAIPAGETLDSAGSPAPEAIGTDSVDGMEEATLTPVASEGTTALGAELPIDAIEQSEQPQEQPRSSVSEERAPKPTIQEPKLIDLFAELRGWSWNAERKRFESGDGVWAQKGDMPSVWDVFSPTGEVNQLVWVAPHFRESESVEVPAEVWSGILNTPTTWLVLSKKGDGQLRMYPGDLLRRMQDAGTLQVFPASYRIRLQ